MTIYRAKYAITDPDAIAVPPDRADRAQALDYQLARRALPVEALHDSQVEVTTPSRYELGR